ncbi:hypothetical protein [Sphingomicrobium astaxanthinifaciens]|uniref:hypothetical protein n=1 Tax=Sphingomicrobium astaxanthinifaciens TaxID=1227949 RepID=UPI001FCAC02B|nr:hypothetical protein [Sphingomicrobium astaxanthinifaciens]MCJ7421019.1 hypothetical protein [Sphingomicrobium astaxanthinifaciens]
MARPVTRPIPFRALLWGLLALPLLLAAVAGLRGAEGFDWRPGDYLAALVLLGGAGLLGDTLLRASGSTAYRLGALVGCLSLLFLCWANLAVGLVGSEDNPFNQVYFALVPLPGLGALLARGSARAMARLMAATAAGFVALAIAALATGQADAPYSSVAEILGLHALFTGLFALAALAFGIAARRG